MVISLCEFFVGAVAKLCFEFVSCTAFDFLASLGAFGAVSESGCVPSIAVADCK